MHTTLFWVLILPLHVFGLAPKHENQTTRITENGPRKNITYHHEMWHPIRFPSVQLENVVSDDELVAGNVDKNSEESIELSCSGNCALPTRELNYTLDEIQELLAFETISEDGALRKTEIRPDNKFVNYLNDWMADERKLMANLYDEKQIHRRRKRSIIAMDTRFPIDDRRYIGKSPFSAAAKISSGCSGVLISEKYVLTAARCIHNGRRYVVPLRDLLVGFRRSRSLRDHEQTESNWDEALFWIRVAKVYIPYGWTRVRQSHYLPLDKDYAVLALKRSPDRPYLNVSVGSPVNVQEGTRLHLNALDTPNDASLYYRFCSLKGETSELLYQMCDGDIDAVGAGVYVRRWDSETGQWTRKIIGVYSGEQTYTQDGETVKNNIALRLTPLKFAQICYWLTGDYNHCNG